MRWTALIFVLIACEFGCQQLVASPATQSQLSESDANREALLHYLKPILAEAKRATRIYYAGECKREGDYYWVSFPHVNVQPPSGSDKGLAAVKGVLRNEKSVKISEGADGIIRIVIGRPPVALLDTKIPLLNFGPVQQYTEGQALSHIEDSKEVGSALRRLGVSRDGVPLRMSLGVNPDSGAPHLPASMSNLTLDQAIDSVAKTFGNIIFYGACTERRLYTVYYVSLEP